MRSGKGELTGKGGEGELALIERIRARAGLKKGDLRVGIGDDCALLALKPGEELAITTDLSIEGRHFRLKWHPPESVGHRTLVRGLSDIAAMGARPLAAFLSLGLPRELTRSRGNKLSWLHRFLDGFLALAERYGIPLAGGDLAESPMIVADIVLTGAVPRGRALLRTGARPGDLLFATGALGGAAAGLERLGKVGGRDSVVGRFSRKDREALAKHLWPEPRIAQGLWLRKRGLATAAMDISDGLSTDADHLCAESGVSAEIDARRLPIDAGASLEQALHGGEDYELLFTASPSAKIPRRIAGVALTRIGRIIRRRAGEPRITLLTKSGREPLRSRGWEHFS